MNSAVINLKSFTVFKRVDEVSFYLTEKIVSLVIRLYKDAWNTKYLNNI